MKARSGASCRLAEAKENVVTGKGVGDALALGRQDRSCPIFLPTCAPRISASSWVLYQPMTICTQLHSTPSY